MVVVASVWKSEVMFGETNTESDVRKSAQQQHPKKLNDARTTEQ